MVGARDPLRLLQKVPYVAFSFFSDEKLEEPAAIENGWESIVLSLGVTTRNMMPVSEQPRACVCCGQRLPRASKMTRSTITKAEAHSKQWSGQEKADGFVEVDLCLQCQIDRAAT